MATATIDDENMQACRDNHIYLIYCVIMLYVEKLSGLASATAAIAILPTPAASDICTGNSPVSGEFEINLVMQ